jgi:hypothetical protein
MWASAQYCLGVALDAKYELTHSEKTLTQTMAAFQEVVGSLPAGNPQREAAESFYAQDGETQP